MYKMFSIFQNNLVRKQDKMTLQRKMLAEMKRMTILKKNKPKKSDGDGSKKTTATKKERMVMPVKTSITSMHILWIG